MPLFICSPLDTPQGLGRGTFLRRAVWICSPPDTPQGLGRGYFLREVDRARDLDLPSAQHFSQPNWFSLCAGLGGRSCGHPQGGHSCIWGQEPVKGRWRGGITVNDSIGQRSGAEMFRIEPTS
jgi:hypothetical protein